MSGPESLSLVERFNRLDAKGQSAVLRPYKPEDRRRFVKSWSGRGRLSQHAPKGEWRTLLILAGRGFGKTRAGAEWVRRMALTMPGARIAIIGATLHEARSIMVEGESGLLRLGKAEYRPKFEPTNRRLVWKNGSAAFLYSADDPDQLRGAQQSHAWGDEIAKWPHGLEAWMNLQMGLRLGPMPCAVLTTTPRPVALIKLLLADPAVVVKRGRTADNAANLAAPFIDAITAAYGGTRYGRQELEGELVEDVEGALWTRALIERCRVGGYTSTGLRQAQPERESYGSANSAHPELDGPQATAGQRSWEAGLRQAKSEREGYDKFRRVVVGVDPPAGEGASAAACGIVVVGLGKDGNAVVIEDASVQGMSPEGWARAVVAAAARHDADRVIAEVNNGGAMVTSVLRAVDCTLPVKAVRASSGKSARAEPVAALYEQGRVSHAGAFPALEDEMCGLIAGGGYAGPGNSPDRADALVWALTELMLKRRWWPGIRGF